MTQFRQPPICHEVAAPRGGIKINFADDSRGTAISGLCRPAHPSASQICTLEIAHRNGGARKTRLACLNLDKARIGDRHEADLSPVDQIEIGAFGRHAFQNGSRLMGPVKTGVRQICAGQINALKVGFLERYTGQIAAQTLRAQPCDQILRRPGPLRRNHRNHGQLLRFLVTFAGKQAAHAPIPS
jgi:hypothetical protein